jgi:hypothetical protein
MVGLEQSMSFLYTKLLDGGLFRYNYFANFVLDLVGKAASHPSMGPKNLGLFYFQGAMEVTVIQ